jgi:hsp70-interacting protein
VLHALARACYAGELQDHVEDIDCACDLSKIGGLPPLLALLRSPHAPVRAAAAEVLATAVQNNPKAQQQALDGGAMEPLLVLARSDDDPVARLKGLLALGCALRICTHRAQLPAAACGGMLRCA